MENVSLDENASMNLANANHAKRVEVAKDKAAMKMGNTGYERMAVNTMKKSMSKEQIEAERSKKEISRRAFLIGTLTGIGIAATTVALGKKIESNIQEIGEMTENQELIDTAYEEIKDEMYHKLIEGSPTDFKLWISDTDLSGYSDYLIYKLTKDYEMTDSLNYKYADEYSKESREFKRHVFEDREDNPDKYEGIIVPDNDYLYVEEDMVNRYINGEDFVNKADAYLQKKMEGVSR